LVAARARPRCDGAGATRRTRSSWNPFLGGARGRKGLQDHQMVRIVLSAHDGPDRGICGRSRGEGAPRAERLPHGRGAPRAERPRRSAPRPDPPRPVPPRPVPPRPVPPRPVPPRPVPCRSTHPAGTPPTKPHWGPHGSTWRGRNRRKSATRRADHRSASRPAAGPRCRRPPETRRKALPGGGFPRCGALKGGKWGNE
jgi:hypothetical protein